MAAWSAYSDSGKMAQRPGFPPVQRPQAASSQRPQSASSISNAHCNNILQNFRQEDVVYALMTQLREKESELTRLNEQRQVVVRQQQITEQSNKQLKSKIDLHNKAVAKKDTKIALLEQNLAQEKKGNGSAIADANLKHLTETNSELQRVLQERDDELSQLRPVMKNMKTRIVEYESKESIQYTERIEAELAQVKGELAIAKNENLTSNGTVEQLEKKVKGKEWMIKSLQEENDDQRSRENHLLAHIKQLDEKIDTYEKRFNGKGVDVPMLLAKLKDYEVRTKDLEGQVRRLTNKKLNELVLRSSPIPHQAKDTKNTTEPRSKPKQDEGKPQQNKGELQPDKGKPKSEEADYVSDVSETYSFLDSEQDDEEELTFLGSHGSDDMEDDPFSSKIEQEEDVLSDFLSDVKVGIQTLEMDSLCCMQRPSPVPVSSPLNRYRGPRSPESYNSIRTFMSGSQ